MNIKMGKENIKITEEKLNKLEKQTKDKFTKKLIEDLKKQIKSDEPELFKQLSFKRIVELIKHERKREELKKFKSNWYNKLFVFEIFGEGKRAEIKIPGNKKLKNLFEKIENELSLDPGHLYEFQIGKYIFGTVCDEWQEIFDALDDYSIGFALQASGLKIGDLFKFRYDFGEERVFKMKILNIQNGKR